MNLVWVAPSVQTMCNDEHLSSKVPLSDVKIANSSKKCDLTSTKEVEVADLLKFTPASGLGVHLIFTKGHLLLHPLHDTLWWTFISKNNTLRP